jgi:hypothetical protein
MGRSECNISGSGEITNSAVATMVDTADGAAPVDVGSSVAAVVTPYGFTLAADGDVLQLNLA